MTQQDLDAGTYSFTSLPQNLRGLYLIVQPIGLEGNTVLISAAIMDNDGNFTFGTESGTTLIIDETAPVIANYRSVLPSLPVVLL